MSSVNKVILIGNLGSDPLRFDKFGSPISLFSIATEMKSKNHTFVEWHEIQAPEKLVPIVQSYCKKGTKVYIEGYIRTVQSTQKDGTVVNKKRIMATSLQILTPKKTATEENMFDAPAEETSSFPKVEAVMPVVLPTEDLPF